jgi:lysophospholipase L1-like esterase
VRRAAAVLLGLAVGLLLAEGLVRVASERLLGLSHPAVRFDPELGWVQRTGETGVRRNEADREVAIVGSPLGIREPSRAYDFTRGDTVLVLGDSFTAGTQVPFDETWAARLQERLRRRFPAAQVVNAGVDRFDLAQEYRLARRLWTKVRPRHLVLGLYLGNDLVDYDIAAGARPPWQPSGPRTWIRESSYLYHFVAGALAQRRRETEAHDTGPSAVAGWSPRSVPGFAALRPDQQDRLRGQFAAGDVLPVLRGGEESDRRLAATEHVLDAFHELAEERAVGLTVVLLPMKQEVLPEQRREWMDLHHLTEMDVARPHRRIAAWAARTGVALVDVTDALRAEPAPDALFWKVDLHMTPRGHALVAEVLEPTVEEGWGRPTLRSGSASPTSSR